MEGSSWGNTRTCCVAPMDCGNRRSGRSSRNIVFYLGRGEAEWCSTGGRYLEYHFLVHNMHGLMGGDWTISDLPNWLFVY